MSYDVDILAFGAHPDDVELFAGGTMLRLADLGHSTAIVDLTRGERASHGTPEERAREAAAAAQVLGLRFRENLGLPDTGLDAGDATQVMAVAGAIRRFRPELVLAPWLEERHPDHAAAGALVAKAVFFAAVKHYATDPARERHAVRQLLHYEMRHHMIPTFVLDTSAVAERKRAAIACHASQLGQPGTLVGSPRAVDAIFARDRHRGSMIGATHGEALRMPNTPAIVDPVKFLRENPCGEAHAFEALR